MQDKMEQQNKITQKSPVEMLDLTNSKNQDQIKPRFQFNFDKIKSLEHQNYRPQGIINPQKQAINQSQNQTLLHPTITKLKNDTIYLHNINPVIKQVIWPPTNHTRILDNRSQIFLKDPNNQLKPSVIKQDKNVDISKFTLQFDEYNELRSQNKSQLQSELSLGNLRDEQYDQMLQIIAQKDQFELKKQQLIGLNICSYNDLMNIEQQVAENLCLESEQFKLMRQEHIKKEPLDEFPIFEIQNKKIKNDIPSISILVIGQTGSGKSSLINMIANACILENENQNFRVRLIKEDQTKLQSESATEKIQSYTIYGRKIKQQIVLIDSPGFADTKGIIVDQKISHDLQDLLSKQLNQLNLICLVKKESDNRLDDLTKYVLGNIFELFGNDIKQNLHLVLTYSSFIPTKPKVLKVFEDKKEFSDILNDMVEPKYSQFDLGDEIIYGKSLKDRFIKNMQSFVVIQKKIQTLAPQSLKLTSNVIITRLQIIEKIELLKIRLLENLNKLSTIHKLYHTLGNQEKKTIKCIYIERIPIENGQYVTNCLVCSETCHFPCFIKRDDRKYYCDAIKRDTGKCRRCNCIWYFHKNNSYRIQMAQTTKIVECRLNEQDNLIADYKKQVVIFYETQQELINLFQKINENALLPDSFSCMKGYFQLMIETEIRQKQLGYEDRVKIINNLQCKYEMINSDELKQRALQQQLSPLMEYVDVSELNKLLLESDYNKLKTICSDQN